MRKIVCHCCLNRRGDSAIWIAFKGVQLCESCRLVAVDYLRNVIGLSLAIPHPFLDEITQVDSPRRRSIRS